MSKHVHVGWAAKATFQPRFEIGKEPIKPKKKLDVEKRTIRGSKQESLLKNKLDATKVGFDKVLSELCSEVETKPRLRKLTPAEIRARRHAEKRFERRFK